MKEINLEQAFYGYKNNGHNRLCKSNLEANLLTFLSKITDLPIHKPPSLKLEPYYGTHVFGRWMIFTKTVADTFSRRMGMVFTHCLIVEVEQLRFLHDMQKVFAHFFKELPRDKQSLDCATIILTQKEETVTSVLSTAKIFINKILSNSSNKCWVVANSPDFLNWYASLWNSLRASMRQHLTFRLSFTSEDKEPDRYLFYIVPSTIIKKWDEDCMALPEVASSPSIGAQWLLQEDESIGFREFIDELSAKVETFEDIELAEKTYELYCKLPDITVIQQIQIVRLIGKISDQPERGKRKKLAILKQIASQLKPRASLSFILSTGNLSLAPFSEGEKVLSPVLNTSVRDLWDNKSADEIQDFIERYQQGGSVAWWTSTVTETIKSIFQNFTSKLALQCWRIWIKYAESFKFCALFLSNEAEYEMQLIINFPGSLLDESLVKSLLTYCRQEHWYLLHAHLLISHFTLKNSLEEQLKLAPEHRASLELITGHYEPLEVVSIAALINNSLLWDVVSEVKVSWQDFVQEFKISEKGWRGIGLAKLEREAPIGEERQEVQKMVNLIFDGIIQGEEMEEGWLEIIANSSFNDILHYPNRQQLWNYLPIYSKPLFLKATARSYLSSKSFKSGVQLEPNFLSEILSKEQLQGFFKQGDASLNDVCNLFETFPSLIESAMEAYLRSAKANSQKMEAIRLGQLVASRRWKNAAQLIYSNAKHNLNYKVALQECVDLLSFWQRLEGWVSGMIPDVSVSWSEWWEAFEELCNNLYYDEFDIKRIWSMVGGDVSHLPNKVSARILWREIILNLQGARSTKTLTKLLDRMENEKHGNSNLAFLKNSLPLLNS